MSYNMPDDYFDDCRSHQPNLYDYRDAMAKIEKLDDFIENELSLLIETNHEDDEELNTCLYKLRKLLEEG